MSEQEGKSCENCKYKRNKKQEIEYGGPCASCFLLGYDDFKPKAKEQEKKECRTCKHCHLSMAEAPCYFCKSCNKWEKRIELKIEHEKKEPEQKEDSYEEYYSKQRQKILFEYLTGIEKSGITFDVLNMTGVQEIEQLALAEGERRGIEKYKQKLLEHAEDFEKLCNDEIANYKKELIEKIENNISEIEKAVNVKDWQEAYQILKTRIRKILKEGSNE